jgi:serine protease
MLKTTRTLIATASLLAAFGAHAQARLAADPMLPSYGSDVQVELASAEYPTYLPATRYSISGSQIVIDYEYLGVGFGPYTPDFGTLPLQLGELTPGNYTVTARLHDINTPAGTAPKVLTSNIAVVPPSSWGIYTVPSMPLAFSPANATIRSAAYFDPASMRTSVNGNVVRVDFVYSNTAPATGAAPAAGMQTYGSVRIPQLAPGTYTLQGWGRTADGAPEKFFERNFTVTSATPVVEYYSPSLDHYFMTINADEIAAIDAGRNGDWKRTGYQFKAWMRTQDAPANAVPVCRFFASGPRSHFFTASASECDFLKSLEQQQRAQAAAAGQRFQGWAYEGIAFYSILPRDGTCPAGMQGLNRFYNDRFAQNDSNHRFIGDPAMRAAMSVSWNDEGPQFCAPL